MCTAISYCPGDHYFGRTLDNEFSYRETVTVTPRRFPLSFRHCGMLNDHRAIIGMAYVQDDYPLYYDAVNEAGLCMAGLNFPGNAHYFDPAPNKDNIASFELIPWLLGQCDTVAQARKRLAEVQITNDAFRADLPPTPLHWLLADRTESAVIESTADGLHCYENPVGVLTNNPPFPAMLWHLSNYMNLSSLPAANRFAPGLELTAESRGMGAMGLPGDLSSQSRFVRAAFTKGNAVTLGGEDDSVSQFFHILGSVSQQRGCVQLKKDVFEITVYTSCCNADKSVYYYTTYGNQRITAVDMYGENLDASDLISYPLQTKQDILHQNSLNEA